MKNSTAGGGLRLSAGANVEQLLRFARDAVRIGERQLHLIVGGFVEIEDAAREHVGRGEIGRAARPDLFVLDAHEIERGQPLLRALLPVRHRDARVAVVVAVEVPGEAERHEGGWVDEQLARGRTSVRTRIRALRDARRGSCCSNRAQRASDQLLLHAPAPFQSNAYETGAASVLRGCIRMTTAVCDGRTLAAPTKSGDKSIPARRKVRPDKRT